MYAIRSYYDLVARCQALEDLLAQSLFADTFDEVFDDLEIDIGFEEG